MSAHMTAAGEHIVRRLGGVWSNGRGMCRCPAHEDRTPSLSVRCGRSALLFKCFAGCTIVEILSALRREKLDVPDGARRKVEGFPPAADMRRYAARLWREGRPVRGTPAERYLRNRAIPAIHDLMRYHPATPLGRGRSVRRLPALGRLERDHSKRFAARNEARLKGLRLEQVEERRKAEGRALARKLDQREPDRGIAGRLAGNARSLFETLDRHLQALVANRQANEHKAEDRTTGRNIEERSHGQNR
ncbi:DUF7146 domain-containing protein [Sphingobium yanoikuyae]|uniref:DUF7146 domain-containing protein n=1 Tax=Sphingobium yanoikuyae TaxID=13690 RepID=UPI0022DE7367|nr:hypothetical protein [Sphingobium yanoikuyae]WBQ19008.1 hypothetical protein PAE53_24505 [Sphingobium yanoikuyae]